MCHKQNDFDIRGSFLARQIENPTKEVGAILPLLSSLIQVFALMSICAIMGRRGRRPLQDMFASGKREKRHRMGNFAIPCLFL